MAVVVRSFAEHGASMVRSSSLSSPYASGKHGYERGRGRAGLGLWRRRRPRGMVLVLVLGGFFFLMNWWMLSRLQDQSGRRRGGHGMINHSFPVSMIQGEWRKFRKGERQQRFMYARLLAVAAHALAPNEDRPEPHALLWAEPLVADSAWKASAHQSNWVCTGYDGSMPYDQNGYVLFSANGGISQQPVTICNAVAVARLLN